MSGGQALIDTPLSITPEGVDHTPGVSLAEQVQNLSAEREKLRNRLKAYAIENERLAAENASVTQAMLNARKLCDAWESQANASLVQIDYLKDLLEESALWQSKPALAGITAQPLFPPKGIISDSEISEQDIGGTTNLQQEPSDAPGRKALQDIEAKLMTAHSKAAQLDTCLRAIAAEVSRTNLITSDIRHATLPILDTVENRLGRILFEMPLDNLLPESGIKS